MQVSEVASGGSCVCEEGGNRVKGNVLDHTLMVASFIVHVYSASIDDHSV